MRRKPLLASPIARILQSFALIFAGILTLFASVVDGRPIKRDDSGYNGNVPEYCCGTILLPDKAISRHDGYVLTVHGVLLGIFLILTGLVILLRVYHDGELGTNARFVSGFIAMALITWVLLTNFEPARTYGTYRWTIYLVVCFVIGAIGGLIIGCTFHLFLMVLSGLGALAFGLWLLGWKDGLLISTNWGRALFLSLLVLAGLVMAPMVWFAPIVGAAFCGAYLFMLGLDMFFHTGFMYALLCSLDTNPNHRLPYACIYVGTCSDRHSRSNKTPGRVSAQAATSANSPNVQSTTGNTTFTTIASYIPPGACQINAYSVNSTFLYSVNASNLQNYDVTHYPELVNVGYLMLGQGSTEIGFYSSYGGPGNAKMLAAVMLAMNDFIVNGRDPITKEDTVSVRLIIGDWQYDYTTFCQLYNYPMPDIIVIGTTAISAAASKGEILALDKHLDEYTQLHNTLLVDSFLKYTLYDYYYTNSWWAVPLTTDTRLLYYNRTTFRALNMTMPPPEGDWGVQYWNDWNWTTFVNYATQIRDHGLGHGYQFNGEFDEESKLITMVARSKILDLFPSNRQCNLLSPIFTEILDDFIRPLWTPTSENEKYPTVANLDFYTTDDNEPLIEWLNQPYEDLVPPDFTIFTGSYGNSSILGMNIDTPANTQYSSNWMLDAINGSNLTEESEIGIGYVPATASFLGGSGLALASTSNKTETAWNLVVQMIDPNQIYLNIINQANGLYPPYDTSSEYPPWSLPQFTVAREQVSHAVPMQYPHTSFPQVSDFENAHIFRQLLLNIVVKNSTNSQAVDAACNVMMEILAPECNSSNWYPSYPETCQPGTQNFVISYQWTNTSGIACKGPTTLPEPYPIACAYANIDTRQSITMLTLTSLCALISIIYGLLLFVYRRTAVVKRASFVFCELVLVGSLFIYSTVYFLAGPAYTWKCQLVIWTVVIGFALLFGSLFCKILRVYKIFNNKAFVTLRLTDWYLLKRLGVILVVEILGLIVLAKVDGGPHAVAYSTYTDPASGQDVMQNKCVYGNLGALIYIAVFNLFLIIYAVALSIATWKVPTQYNESKFVIAASYAVGFGAILLAPLIFFVTDPVARLMIIGLTIDFGVVISVSIFCVPKIYTAIRLYRQETIRQHSDNTLERVRSGRSCNCGEVHHPWWKFWRHQSDNCPAQLTGGHVGHEKGFRPQQPFIRENIRTKFVNQEKPKSRALSPGSLGWVYEEDVLRTSKRNYIIPNVNDLNIAPNEEAISLTETDCCSPDLPAKSLTRRSTIDRRTSSVSSMSEAHRRPLQSSYPEPLSIGDPRWNQGHCPHCGTGFGSNNS